MKQTKAFYVNFKNSATGQDVNAEIISEFAKAGFRNEPNIKNADFIILGDVQSFSRTTKRDPRFSMGMGYGFGRPSFGFGYSMFFPFGYDDYDDDFSTNSYAYYMQVSVLVRPKMAARKRQISRSCKRVMSIRQATFGHFSKSA